MEDSLGGFGMILVVDVCREKLHFHEFVKPVLDILSDEDVLASHYLDLSEEDLQKCDRVIICGTSLKDDLFLKDIDKFDWLKGFDKPVLGICAGFQILGLVSGGKLKKESEIGFFKEKFDKKFLGLEGEVEVYHLHGNYIDFSEVEMDELVVGNGGVVQAVKLNNFYGVLFHPEVRNREMILRFVHE